MNETETKHLPMVSSDIFSVLAGILFFFSMVFDLQSFIMFSLLFLCVHIATRLWSKASHRHVHCNLLLDKKRVFPGESFALGLDLENAKFLPIGFRIRIPGSTLFHSTDNGNGLDRQGALLWFQKITFRLDLEATCRGIYEIGSSHLITSDLFDFFQNKLIKTPSTRLIVYPRIVELSPIFLSPKEFFGIPGARTPVQDPLYIEGTRDYQPGTPSKYIHWKASARHLRLQEKVFEPTVQQKILFVVDVNGFFENNGEMLFERMLEVIASLSVLYGRKGYPVGLLTNGVVAGNGRSIVPISTSPQQLAAILESLAGVAMTPFAEIGEVLHAGFRLSSGTSLIYASYSNDRRCSELHEYFKKIRSPVVSIIGCSDSIENRVQGTYFTINDICGESNMTLTNSPMGL